EEASRGDPRRGAEPDRSAAGLPFRAALPLRHAGLPSGPSAAAQCRRRTQGRLHPRAREPAAMSEPLLQVKNLTKEFDIGAGFLLRNLNVVHAVDNVSFQIEAGETLGLVGESGSGKSTTGRCILRLIEPTSGEVWFQGRKVSALD